MSEQAERVQGAEQRPMTTGEKGCGVAVGLLTLGAAGLVLWMAALFLGIGGGPAPLREAQRGNVQGECHAAVLRMLQVPGSGQIPFDPAPTWEGSRWVWRSTVTAQTPYGGQATTPFVCTVTGPDANTLSADVVVQP